MNLSDSALLQKTEELVAQERELLREIDKRSLFSALGFKSLFEYAVKKLKYSEDQAGRRISAMRLLRDLTQIEEKIESGAHFRQEEKKQIVSVSDKLKLLGRLEYKTQSIDQSS